MSEIFKGCSSLSFLPDISKWNINNITYRNDILYGCMLLVYIPYKIKK